jgi:hypothetical protein
MRIEVSRGSSNLFAGTEFPGGRIDHFIVRDGFGRNVEDIDKYYDGDGKWRRTERWYYQSYDIGNLGRSAGKEPSAEEKKAKAEGKVYVPPKEEIEK